MTVGLSLERGGDRPPAVLGDRSGIATGTPGVDELRTRQ